MGPPREFVPKLKTRGIPGLDTEIFETFVDARLLSKRDIDRLANMAKDDVVKSTHIFEFDLKGSDVTAKGYVLPQAKHLTSNIPMQDLIFDSVLGLSQKMDCEQALRLVHEYMVESSNFTTDSQRMSLEITWAKIQDAVTLGGRTQNQQATRALLEVVWKLWKCIGGERHGDLENASDFRVDGKQISPLAWTFNYELVPGNPFPEPKVYFALDGMHGMAVVEGL
ncbi:tryptophan dimethylallyltransferase-domain-containing protein [Aspergillus floccosus]